MKEKRTPLYPSKDNDEGLDAYRVMIQAVMEEREKGMHRIFGISCLSLALEAFIFLIVSLLLVTILYRLF